MIYRVLAAFLLLLPLASRAETPDAREEFEKKVRPLLASNCWTCHRQTAMGGLRLDSGSAILKGGKHGPAIVPGNPDQSLLIQAVRHSSESLKMPPQGKLADEQLAILTKWIKDGAYWPPDDPPANAAKSTEFQILPEHKAFWAFQPVRRPQPPPVENTSWVRSPIDRFILSRLEKEGLKPVGRTDKRTLIRRATFDLTGLPPSPDDVDAFLADDSPGAFGKVVDRLLASAQYGERWGRYWLDIARYADDQFNSTQETPYPSSFRYRNWVIDALNRDLPYDRFVKAQIAGDQVTSREPAWSEAALGFYALSPEMQDDRVDVTSKAFLGLTVACAQCHDHKFDPIPAKDFYSLQGIFDSTRLDEYPLTSTEVVESWKSQSKNVEKQSKLLSDFYDQQRDQLAQILSSRTAEYMLSTRNLSNAADLDCESQGRMRAYLEESRKDHSYLDKWFRLVREKAPANELRAAAAEFQSKVIEVLEEKRLVDEKNKLTLGLDPSRNQVASASLVSLDREKYVLWRDMFDQARSDAAGFFRTPEGIFHYGGRSVERFLEGPWRTYADRQKTELERLRKALPPKYPFLQVISDVEKPHDINVAIRGDRNNKGDVAPRRFLAILSKEARKPFTEGSGRKELAGAIADPSNPLTARVMVNRIWAHHFGRGIVATPSNFGQLGERPTHPELLDYLASEFVASGWSVKAMHRLILLSSTYALSAMDDATNSSKDGANLLLWRANRRRLDVESMRDSILFAAGQLDLTPGKDAGPLTEDNHKRTVYGFVSRRKLDPTLALFDFPNPNSTAEGRMSTSVPLHRLYFMNSPFLEQSSQAFAERFAGSAEERITGMYRVLFGREPDEFETKAALEYLQQASWPSYARVLLSSNEFLFLN